MKRKKALYGVYGQLEISWECPSCRSVTQHNIEISDIEGGCTGGHDGGYCYCPSREYRETLTCPSCSTETEVFSR